MDPILISFIGEDNARVTVLSTLGMDATITVFGREEDFTIHSLDDPEVVRELMAKRPEPRILKDALMRMEGYWVLEPVDVPAIPGKHSNPYLKRAKEPWRRKR